MPVICRVSNLILVGSLLLAPGVALSQDATIKPHVPLEKTIGQTTPTGPVPSLAVLNAAGAKLEGGKLTLTGVAPNSFWRSGGRLARSNGPRASSALLRRNS